MLAPVSRRPLYKHIGRIGIKPSRFALQAFAGFDAHVYAYSTWAEKHMVQRAHAWHICYPTALVKVWMLKDLNAACIAVCVQGPQRPMPQIA